MDAGREAAVLLYAADHDGSFSGVTALPVRELDRGVNALMLVYQFCARKLGRRTKHEYNRTKSDKSDNSDRIHRQ